MAESTDELIEKFWKQLWDRPQIVGNPIFKEAPPQRVPAEMWERSEFRKKSCCKNCDVGQRFKLKASGRIVTVVEQHDFGNEAVIQFDDGESVHVIWQEFVKDAERIG